MAFDYRTPFPASVPANVPEFRRTFQHENWIDGESVVQAETNEIEEGFNSRLHKIEADLDALSTDTGRAFTALAAMRSSLRALLDEIRTELSRLDPPQRQAWQTANLLRGWQGVSTRGTRFPFSPVGYFMDRSGVVHLRGGLIKIGDHDLDPIQGTFMMFNLPERYRPQFTYRLAPALDITRLNNHVFETPGVFVDPDGRVSIENFLLEEESVFLDGLCFWSREDTVTGSTSSAGFRDDIGIGGDQL